MYSDFTFSIDDVDPKGNIVWLTIDTESRERAKDISTLRKFTNNPDIHDSLVNAYVIANAIIPESTLWEIVSMNGSTRIITISLTTNMLSAGNPWWNDNVLDGCDYVMFWLRANNAYAGLKAIYFYTKIF